MTAIYQSPFLLALGWAIASSLWQAGLLWLFYQLLINPAKKIKPAYKHNLSYTFLLVAFGWFCVTLFNKYQFIAQLQLTQSETIGATAFLMPATNSSYMVLVPSYIIEKLNQLLPYISAAYLLILVLLWVRLLNAYSYAQKIKTTGLEMPTLYLSQLTEKYTRWLHLKRDIRIYLSHYIDVPATLNYFKPIILLPVAAVNNLTPQQIESVILHELSHVKRNDYLINIVVSTIETILFFNPFVYMLAKTLRKEREHSCDDMVLHFRFDPHSYASALLFLEKLRLAPAPAAAIAATGNNNNYQLLDRVKRIMNVHNQSFNYGQKLLALLVTACMLLSLAWLVPEKKSAQQESSLAESQPLGEGSPAAIKEVITPNPNRVAKKNGALKPDKSNNTWSPENEPNNKTGNNTQAIQPDNRRPRQDKGNLEISETSVLHFLTDHPDFDHPESFSTDLPQAPTPPAAPSPTEYAPIELTVPPTEERWQIETKRHAEESARLSHMIQLRAVDQAKQLEAQQKKLQLLKSNWDQVLQEIQFEGKLVEMDKLKELFKKEVVQKIKLDADGKQIKALNLFFRDVQEELRETNKIRRADSIRVRKKQTQQKSIWVSHSTEDESNEPTLTVSTNPSKNVFVLQIDAGNNPSRTEINHTKNIVAIANNRNYTFSTTNTYYNSRKSQPAKKATATQPATALSTAGQSTAAGQRIAVRWEN